MLNRHVLELTAVALTGLAADLLTSDAVLFEVRPEVPTRKTYELTTSSVVEEAVLDLGGMGEHNPGEGMKREGLSTFEVEDECLAAEEGRPTRLRRRYTSLAVESRLDAPEQPGVVIAGDHDRDSDLEDHVVLFDRDAESGAWIGRFAEDDDGEEEWLAGLRADMDFLRFLPRGEVEPGDRWDVEVAAIEDFFEPGGELMVLAGSPDGPDMPEGGIAISIGDTSKAGDWSELEGDVTVEFREIRELDAGRLGVLVVTVDVEGVQNVAAALEEDWEGRGSEVAYSLAEIERVVAGRGEIVWNLTRGCLHSVVFEATTDATTDMEWSQDAGGMELDLALHQVTSDTLELRVEVQ